MDPIRRSPDVPPLTSIARSGSQRPATSPHAGAADERARGREREPAPPSSAPARRGSSPHRVEEDLARLAAALDDEASAGAPRDEAVRARLAALALGEPDAEAVRDLAGRAGVPLRVAILAAAAELRALDPATSAARLVERLFRALAAGGASAARSVAPLAGELASAADAALRVLGADGLPRGFDRPVEGVPSGIGREHLARLAAAFLAHLERELSGPGGEGRGAASRQGLAALLRALDPAARAALAGRLAGPLLGAVLASPAGTPLREKLAARALAAIDAASPDARVAVLAELAAGGASRERSPAALLASVVGALESEAAANAARREAGEATTWTIPVLDGGRWSVVRLREDRHGQDARDGNGGASGDVTRVALGTEFTALGPVRADLAVGKDRVIVRMIASEPSTAQILRRAAEALRASLATGEREVWLAVADGTPEQARVELPPHAVDSLDLEG